jgi:hypothetical protein
VIEVWYLTAYPSSAPIGASFSEMGAIVEAGWVTNQSIPINNYIVINQSIRMIHVQQ